MECAATSITTSLVLFVIDLLAASVLIESSRNAFNNSVFTIETTSLVTPFASVKVNSPSLFAIDRLNKTALISALCLAFSSCTFVGFLNARKSCFTVKPNCVFLHKSKIFSHRVRFSFSEEVRFEINSRNGWRFCSSKSVRNSLFVKSSSLL